MYGLNHIEIRFCKFLQDSQPSIWSLEVLKEAFGHEPWQALMMGMLQCMPNNCSFVVIKMFQPCVKECAAESLGFLEDIFSFYTQL